MRLLLDESVPRLLAEELRDHEVDTVPSIGWSGVGNGELLALAADAGFDALITTDRGFEFQHNLGELPVTVAILEARSNRIEHLLLLVPELLEKLGEGQQKTTLIKVGA